MNTAAKGARNERKTRKWFQDRGYISVARAAASKGLYDIIMRDSDVWLCIQVKSNRKPPPRERLRIEHDLVPKSTAKIIVIWYDRNPEPEVIEYGPTKIYPRAGS